MILDSLKNGEQYVAIHPDFSKAIKFINENASTIPVGKYYLDGDNVYVMVVETELRKPEAAKPEAHREYIDIQIVLQGVETFAWAELGECNNPIGEYDQENDIIFFNDRPSTFITIHQGQFVIFFPEDVHAPLIGEGQIRKAVIKVRLNETARSEQKPKTQKVQLSAEQIEKLEALKKWRVTVADSENIPVFRIATNRELEDVVLADPANCQELMKVKGFKEWKVGRYGDDIIALLNSF